MTESDAFQIPDGMFVEVSLKYFSCLFSQTGKVNMCQVGTWTMERPSDVQIQSFSMPFSSSVVKHTLLSLLRIFWAYSVLLTPSLKQRKSVLMGK